MTVLNGNAVVGQSGGPTAAINATLAGVISGALKAKEIGKIYGMRNGIEGLLEERLIELDGIFSDKSKLKTLMTTPAAALGSCRKKLPEKNDYSYAAVFDKIIKVFRKYDIKYFFYIGGNDSMDTVKKLSEYTDECGYEMRVVGVPKTIDNDIIGTDHTPGYGCAAKYIATTMQEILYDTDVYTTKAVTVVELMGRDTGWLTAASALGRICGGKSPDLVYLPERVFSMENFFHDIVTVFSRKPNAVVAVSEGLRFEDGRYVGEGVQSGNVDAFGHRALSGTGKSLEIALRERFGCKARSVELNLPQRCASHLLSACDINESFGVGNAAVSAALQGVSREMMVILRDGEDDGEYSSLFGHMDIELIANKTKYVPDNFINQQGNNVTDKCLEYILPLVNGEIYPAYKKGMPEYFTFDM